MRPRLLVPGLGGAEGLGAEGLAPAASAALLVLLFFLALPEARFPGGLSVALYARGGELLDPIVDGEMFYGMDRVSVRLGPKVSVLALAGRGPGF